MPGFAMASNTQKAARAGAFGLLAVCALSGFSCHDSSSGPEQVDPAAFSWNAPISAPKTVFLRNTNGSVEVKPSTDGNVTVTAEVRWRSGDPLGFVPDQLMDDPEGTKQGLRDAYHRLLELDFDLLLLAHGDPVVGGGKETLRGFLGTEQ